MGDVKSPVVQEDDHLLTVLRYVEANPWRAGIVADLKDYPWTSYAAHGLGQPDPLLSAAPVWSGLGASEVARQASWRRWVHELLTERELTAVRRSVTSGRPFGSEGWAEALGRQQGWVAPRPRGRPRKQPAVQAELFAEK